MKSVEFTFAGIDFKIDFLEDALNHRLDELIGVSIWDEEKSKFGPISVDFEGFLDDLQDQIDQALEEMYENKKQYVGDLKYDAMKDDMINWKNLED